MSVTSPVSDGWELQFRDGPPRGTFPVVPIVLAVVLVLVISAVSLFVARGVGTPSASCAFGAHRLISRDGLPLPRSLEPMPLAVTLTRNAAGITVEWQLSRPLEPPPLGTLVNMYVDIYPTRDALVHISHQYALGIESFRTNPHQPAWDARSTGPRGAHRVRALTIQGAMAKAFYSNAVLSGIPDRFLWTAEFDETLSQVKVIAGQTTVANATAVAGCPVPDGGYGSNASPMFNWSPANLLSFPGH